jgi:Lrp/AsnC family transcriptional regulator for asnA, asnC and gidA
MDDPRASVARIAQRLATPESTVRHRLNRLVQNGTIEFGVMTNPRQLGYAAWAMIQVQAAPTQIRSVARRLAAAPEVYFVMITTGTFNIVATAVFRSNEDFLDFVTRALSRVPGVAQVSTASVLQVVKRTLALGLPQEQAGPRTRSAPAGTGPAARPSDRPTARSRRAAPRQARA